MLVVAIAVEAAPAKLQALSWMSGSWGGTQAGSPVGTEIEEHWTSANGGLLLGMHRDLKAGRVIGFEFLRIEEEGDSLVYVSQPQGQPPTRFPLREMQGRRVVFENPTHDFPQRILYWQPRPGTLAARIEGTVNGKQEAMEWTWTSRPFEAPGSQGAGEK
jgi:hypothetical protein